MFKPAKDDLQITESDLSKQLHSSVRTPNLETSLRLLSQGADPNYFHPEKNSSPLSVACRAGQVCQVELLLVYGADPAAVDLEAKTAGDHAKAAGFHGLASRILNAQYELSDRLSFFLCGKRPEHNSNNKHFLIPEPSSALAESAKQARKKMTGLSNKVFEELAVDVYDEVDRRETDKLWSQTESSQTGVPVPFLPVNPDYSATRNQGRQKLARLTDQEFSSLVVDVLKEIRRRQCEIETARGPAKTDIGQALSKLSVVGGQQSDEEPLYDSVASDDDYYVITDSDSVVARQQSARLEPRAASACSNTTASTTLQRSKSLAAADREIQPAEFCALKEQLECSEKKVQALIASNDDMRSELAKLQSTVKKLVQDNKDLQRSSLSPSHNSQESPQHSLPRYQQSPQSPGSRSHSMYEVTGGYRGETRSGPTSLPGPGTSYMTVGPGGQSSPRNYQANSRRDSHDQPGYSGPGPGPRYNPAYNESGTHSLPYSLQNNYDVTLYQVGNLGQHSRPVEKSLALQEVLPSQEEVVRRTEAITRCIQELLISAKDEKVRTIALHCHVMLTDQYFPSQFDSFIPCSERIVRAVTDMVLLFPEVSLFLSLLSQFSLTLIPTARSPDTRPSRPTSPL